MKNTFEKLFLSAFSYWIS